MKKVLPIVLVLAAVIVAAIVFLPKWYAERNSSDVAAPTLSESSASAAPGTEINGTWTAGEGSYAGYRVDEILRGEPVTVVGRTENVQAEATIEHDTLNAATVVVDLASVTTDADKRDNYFRTKAIDTTVYPEATFTVTEPATITPGQTNEIPGELTINGTPVPVVANVEVAQNGEILEAAGSVPVTWADFNVEAPSLGFVEVEDHGSIEFLLKLQQ